jgi:hypothetical protein
MRRQYLIKMLIAEKARLQGLNIIFTEISVERVLGAYCMKEVM